MRKPFSKGHLQERQMIAAPLRALGIMLTMACYSAAQDPAAAILLVLQEKPKDQECTLTVDDYQVPAFTDKKPFKAPVVLGEHYVSFECKDSNGLTQHDWERTVKVERPEQIVVRIELLGEEEIRSDLRQHDASDSFSTFQAEYSQDQAKVRLTGCEYSDESFAGKKVISVTVGGGNQVVTYEWTRKGQWSFKTISICR